MELPPARSPGPAGCAGTKRLERGPAPALAVHGVDLRPVRAPALPRGWDSAGLRLLQSLRGLPPRGPHRRRQRPGHLQPAERGGAVSLRQGTAVGTLGAKTGRSDLREPRTCF
ncbi:uncharacterized protein LOC144581629 [Callithrix jacchus]